MSEINKKEYRAFLYKLFDGDKQPTAKVFTGEAACDVAMMNGWVDSPVKCAAVKIPEEIKEQVTRSSDLLAADANVLANADSVDSIELLMEAYEHIANKKMHHSSAKSIEGARKACKKLLGDIDGNS